jgi:RNA polymerase sigma-70 factor, ECF subfamily
LIAAVHHLEKYRVELTGFCRRIVGSPDAEDAVQETFIRALRGFDRFERRGSLQSWLYRIARNVCFDMLEGQKRRARPIDLGPAGEPAAGRVSTQAVWTEPIRDSRLVPEGDPADVTDTRETVRLAIIAVLHLTPRQRAALILCEVLRWKASEVAELLETSVASVTSALQRARAALAARDLSAETPISVGEVDSELLARYVRAFEGYDLDALTELARADSFRSANELR